MNEEEIESILYIGREVSVFKIPPLKKNEGHRAGEWGDLAAPLWKGLGLGLCDATGLRHG